MGIGNLFKSSKAGEPKHGAPIQLASSPSTPGHATPPHMREGSIKSTRAPSIAPSARSQRSNRYFDDLRYEVMCSHIYQSQSMMMWIQDAGSGQEGVVVKKSRDQMLTAPPQLANSTFAYSVAALNVPAALTVNSPAIRTFLQMRPDTIEIPLPGGLRVQCLPQMTDLSRARKHQCAALIVSEGLLVVWDDEPDKLMDRARHLEQQFVQLVWTTGEPSDDDDDLDEKKDGPFVTIDDIDEDTGEVSAPKRPTNLQNSILVMFTLMIITVMVGAGYRSIVMEITVDGNYTRLALIALTPLQIFFSLFFCQVIVGCTAEMIGPVKQMKLNSKFYSGLKSPRLTGILPHITIQCPVYKEGLQSVINPTIRSIKAAISTYELQGGTANIFINDDGLQLVDEEERQARLDFYEDNNIGFVARPRHGEDGFLRRGKFKKASNMNYALMISCQVEDKLAEIERGPEWTTKDEAAAYMKALEQTIEAHEGRAWADGNIRIGDYILLIDSDTRVPTDCLLDACSEMEQSPDVGIMQFSSGVMNVTDSYFEKGITFFTNLIYTAIRFYVANGDVAPFVGHNAILRWSAIQQVSYMDEDNYEKFWSESHVSEDFDMSLRLQVNGYVIRLAAWAGEGFKEGVSLTVYDELARWEKYAYGCNELLFHPIRYWLWRGPFTPLFRKFLASNVRFTSKITIISYIGTYYAIGASWIMTTANYFAVGLYAQNLDKYYVTSWNVWFAVVLVFNGLGNIALAVMRYRTGEKKFFSALWENFSWVSRASRLLEHQLTRVQIPMFAVFLGGLSLHVSQALLSHMFEFNMQWGATSKEATKSNFFIEVPKVLKRFKFSIAFSLLLTAVMVVFSIESIVTWKYVITDFTAILPLSTVVVSHFLLPIALNPALMTFSF